MNKLTDTQVQQYTDNLNALTPSRIKFAKIDIYDQVLAINVV